MHYALNMKGNSKTAIPTTTSSKATCPDTCPLKGSGCYAKYSFLGAYWNKLSNGDVKNAMSFDVLLDKIRGLKDGQLWRHNQAGDLPHVNGEITKSKAYLLAQANQGKRGFTYTHHEPTKGKNGRTIKHMNDSGLTVNLSANDLSQADEYTALNIAPVVSIVPEDQDKVSYTPAGHKVVVCPAQTHESTTCKTCGLCAVRDRDYIIGFRAHGTGKKRVELIATSAA